jgi:hypothetical protein
MGQVGEQSNPRRPYTAVSWGLILIIACIAAIAWSAYTGWNKPKKKG